MAANATKQDIEGQFECFNFRPLPGCDIMAHSHDRECGHTACQTLAATHCLTCDVVIDQKMKDSLKTAGGIGLFFSFSEIVGIWLATKYRNLNDPRANPNAFL